MSSTTEPTTEPKTQPSQLLLTISRLKHSGDQLRQSASHLTLTTTKLQQASNSLNLADTSLKESAQKLKHNADALKAAAASPAQTAESLDQASREVREATQRFTIANGQLELASIEVKRAAAELEVELEEGMAGFNQDARKLEGEVEEFLSRVEFVDVAGLGGDRQIVGEVLGERIREYEEEKSRGAMLELIELFDEYSGYLDDVMVLKGE